MIPRRSVEHGALPLEEMDVDAVVRRAPELTLIDELAHTNALGSRNAKRYEDIEEILAAGIDVTSTVNVQHLESLNDLVFELTGVRVRETFPDRVLDEADQVVLVDLTPRGAAAAPPGGEGLPRARRRTRAPQLLSIREPRRAARACAARGRRGRRRAPAHGGSRHRGGTAPGRPPPLARHAAGTFPALAAAGLALGAAARWARSSTCSG